METNKRKNLIVGALVAASVLVILLLIWMFNRDNLVIEPRPEGRIKAVASIFPVYDIMRQIGGDRIDTVLLLPPGASPHTFDPSPRTIQEIQDANLFVFVGAGADSWAESLVDEENVSPNSRFIATHLSQVVNIRRFSENTSEVITEEEDDHAEGDIDPHFWLSPENAVFIANEIATRLSQLDNENADYYRERTIDFIAQLEIRDEVWKMEMNRLEDKKLIVFHDAWYYFADHYGLEIVASIEPFPGKSPSPKYLQSVIDEIRENNIDVLFIEPQLSADTAEAMAQNLVNKVEVLDPIGGVEGRDSYMELIDYNVRTIVDALGN